MDNIDCSRMGLINFMMYFSLKTIKIIGTPSKQRKKGLTWTSVNNKTDVYPVAVFGPIQLSPLV